VIASTLARTLAAAMRRAPRRPRLSPRRPELETLEARNLLSGWTSFTAPEPIGTMLLLSDGTVMAQGGLGTNNDGVSKVWYKLTPDSTGSYVNGTWTTLASMSTERLYFASNVLTDGRVWVEGGEYSGSSGSANWTNTGEIYDPAANTWTAVSTFPNSSFGDDPSEVLDNGQVLTGYISGPQTYLYDPTTDTWTPTGTKMRNDASDEESWVKIPGGDILSYDVFSSSATAVHAQKYDPTKGTWVDAGTPTNLLSSSSYGSELGPAILLPGGRVFQVGANTSTDLYTPSTGKWAAGPSLPTNMGADDAPGAVLPDGEVIFAADTSVPDFTAPTRLFKFDRTKNTVTNITSTLPSALQTTLSGVAAFQGDMLILPTGQLLYSPDRFNSSTLWVYTPSAAASTSWQPTVSSVKDDGGGKFTLTGTQITGMSEGAYYGDDNEMSSNYPIIQLKDSTGGIHYARSSNWSTTEVQTGKTSETTDFQLPSGLSAGTYTLKVIANGIASAGFSITFTSADVGGARPLTALTRAPAVRGSAKPLHPADPPSEDSNDTAGAPPGFAWGTAGTRKAGFSGESHDGALAGSPAAPSGAAGPSGRSSLSGTTSDAALFGAVSGAPAASFGQAPAHAGGGAAPGGALLPPADLVGAESLTGLPARDVGLAPSDTAALDALFATDPFDRAG
jgi:hypothetical protein